MKYTQYCYSLLDPQKQKIYQLLYQGFSQFKTRISIQTDLSPEEINDVAIAVYNDNPMFFYLNISSFAYYETMFGYEYVQTYTYNQSEIQTFKGHLQTGIQNFKRKYIRPHMTDYEKVKVIHDYLVHTVIYDTKAEQNANPKHLNEASSVVGALLKGKAVCWGIASAFKLLCDACEIQSLVVVGDACLETEEGHAWNMAQIDGEFYHIDVTWDIKIKGDISSCYDYFNLNDRLMQVDHKWNMGFYPSCNAYEYNYYYRNRFYVGKLEELTKFIASRLIAKKTYVSVKFDNKMPNRLQLERAIKNGFWQAGKYCRYQYMISEKSHNIYIEIVDEGKKDTND